MSHIVWAVRPDGGRIAVDLESCVWFEVRFDERGSDWLHFRPSDALWILRRERWAGKVRNGQICGKQLTDYIPEVLTVEEAAAKFKEAGKAIPPELAELENADTQSPALRPHWDRDGRQLWYGETLCRDFGRRNAPAQICIVEACDKAEWKKSIQAPFRDKTLRDNIRSLNNGLEPGSPIAFDPSGSGRMAWRLR